MGGGQIDNVNDPVYNMKNVIKQSILLEEHLAEDNKYCKACCVKHFNHIIGLIEEAIWMSCDKKNPCPMMKESQEIYSDCFELWQYDMNDKDIRRKILTCMRKTRQELISSYYLSDKKAKIKGSSSTCGMAGGGCSL